MSKNVIEIRPKAYTGPGDVTNYCYVEVANRDSTGKVIADYLAVATTTHLGTVKAWNSSTDTALDSKEYAVKVSSTGAMTVSVPWTDTNTTYSAMSNTNLGLGKTSEASKQGTALNTYAVSGVIYADINATNVTNALGFIPISPTSLSTTLASYVTTSSLSTTLSSYATTSAMNTAIANAITGVIKFKGSDTYENIIAKTGMTNGDMWNATNEHSEELSDGTVKTWEAGTNWVWESEDSSWKPYGRSTVDLSTYCTDAELTTKLASYCTTTTYNALAGRVSLIEEQYLSNLPTADQYATGDYHLGVQYISSWTDDNYHTYKRAYMQKDGFYVATDPYSNGVLDREDYTLYQDQKITYSTANGQADIILMLPSPVSGTYTIATTDDLSSYLTTANAASTYLTISSASSTYLTITNASSTYQKIFTSATGITISGTTISADFKSGGTMSVNW
jgi:hypothetical protein